MSRPPSALPEALPADPLPLLDAWYREALEVLRGHNPEAMALATVDASGAPRARMVICRGMDCENGSVVFYTDRSSQKGAELARHPRASLLFYWGDPLHRQLRIDGPVRDLPDAMNDAYFGSRPGGSQVAAVASLQSQPIASREDLVRRHHEAAARLGVDPEGREPADVPRPERWGGYRVWIDAIEFWAGQTNRLHDRARFERVLEPDGDTLKGGSWTGTRLDP